MSGTNGKATKTGDVTPIIPAAAGVILSMAAIVVVLKKEKDNKKESRSGTEIKNGEIQKTVTRKDS